MNEFLEKREIYETRCPSNQNIFDRFDGGFVSIFPNVITRPGNFNATHDDRVKWVNEVFPLKDKTILECGPLELGHSYMMQNYGASNIISVESNWNCYIKCLVVKDIYKLDKVEIKFGDINKYIENTCDLRVDFALVSGILYHLENPVQLIKNLSNVANNIFIWTHVYDPSSPTQSIQDVSYTTITFEDEVYEGAKQKYRENSTSTLYCGGTFYISFWITENSLYKALNKYGFNNIIKNEALSDKSHPNGPSISVFCSKT